MANLLKSFLDSMKITEEDDDDYDDYVSEEEEKERRKAERLEKKQMQRQEKKSFASRSTADDYPSSSRESSNVSPVVTTNLNEARRQKMDKPTPPVSKVVPLRSAARGLEVCIMKPTSFEDSQDICDMLLAGRAAVINLEGFDVDIAQRVMDFISGAVYSLNGKLHQISSYIFIISPDSVDISGDYLDLIRQNGFEVPTLNKEF
ncbi:MAG: cell division protein SepF [Clostridiales bacterium]|nr:cell division protein SepF [Clostridiales bacterium]